MLVVSGSVFGKVQIRVVFLDPGPYKIGYRLLFRKRLIQILVFLSVPDRYVEKRTDPDPDPVDYPDSIPL